MLKVNNLNLEIAWKKILDDINFSCWDWEILSLLWHNGSWKTTLLKSIVKLVDTKWEIIYEWKDISDLDISERVNSWIAYIMQEVPEYTWIKVYDYVKNILDFHKKFDEAKVTELFDMFGLDWNIYKERNFDTHLSWWEKKKIEIITTFLMDKKLYLLDEIEASLDATSRDILTKLIKKMNLEWKSFIIVSHNQDLIKLASNALLLCNWKKQVYWNTDTILDLYLWRCENCNLPNNCE